MACWRTEYFFMVGGLINFVCNLCEISFKIGLKSLCDDIIISAVIWKFENLYKFITSVS